MKFGIKTAGSLVLSSLNLFFCAAGLSLVYTRLSPDLGAVIIWLVSPPLFLFSVIYVAIDLLKPTTRKQAICRSHHVCSSGRCGLVLQI